MDTHRDADIPQELREKQDLEMFERMARQMRESGASQITGGKEGEKPIAEYAVGTIYCRKMPDDPLALRISIGEGHNVKESAYCVFRGNVADVIELLDRALSALKASDLLFSEEP
jgi:hypothetical protein